MVKERRRFPRTAVKIPIKLTLRNDTGGTMLVGPISALLTDISLCGCRIELNRIFIDNHHLFYGAQESNNILDLEILTETEEKLVIPVSPVWFDRISIEGAEIKHFELGVEFTPALDNAFASDLKKLIEKRGRRQGWWFSRLFCCLGIKSFT